MLNSRIILITGATDGIGRETAVELNRLGYRVIVHGRSNASVLKASREIANSSKKEVYATASADFSSLSEVRKMALEIRKKHGHLDVLINNAGVFKNSYEESREGYELTFAINHLAHFLLSLHLLPLLDRAPEGRIINVASMAQSSGINLSTLNLKQYFSGYGAYGASKLCNVLFTNQLARLVGSKLTVNSLHPGVISTKLLQAGFGMGGASLKEGAKTSVYLASSPGLSEVSGQYFVNCRRQKSTAVSYNESLQQELWDMSLKMVSDYLPEDGWLDGILEF